VCVAVGVCVVVAARSGCSMLQELLQDAGRGRVCDGDGILLNCSHLGLLGAQFLAHLMHLVLTATLGLS
jgi:hypothetical protein